MTCPTSLRDIEPGIPLLLAPPGGYLLAEPPFCPAGGTDSAGAQRAGAHESGHSLTMTETGSTGEAANVFVSCDECGARRPMSDAFGEAAERSLPACRGRHPHLGTFQRCDRPTRTLVLGSTNSWFPLQLRAFTLPRGRDPLEHLIVEFWRHLEPLASLPEPTAKQLMPTQTCWTELEAYGPDRVWQAIRARAAGGGGEEQRLDRLDLLALEWAALTGETPVKAPDFTTHHEPVPADARSWLDQVVLVSRLREVAALYGFTRIDMSCSSGN